MKKQIWVIVANSSSAVIYEAVNNNSLKEVERFDHPNSRLHDQDLVSSRPGRTFDSMGPGRHAMEPPTSPKYHEFQVFAQNLAKRLEHAANEFLFTRLYVAANPQFLGILRDTFSTRVKNLIAAEVDKDLTTAKEELIRSHLPPVL